MCGITGLYDFNSKLASHNLIREMTKRLIHRGPDDQDVWIKDAVALGHARLSIHDLNITGRQPMLSFDQQWMIVFNGEIYNFDKIKLNLLNKYSIPFAGASDTEVLVNAIAVWGIEKTLQACVGMFAFAVFHISSKTLYLARDRFGEKPLYYSMQKNILGFSSELKALKPLVRLGWQFDIDRDVLATYMRFSYVPTPHSIYKRIHKLEPGTYISFNERGEKKSNYYWESKTALAQPKFSGDYLDAVDILEEKIKQSVQMQMCSDVPVGAFLSGGIDSSTIVALMQSLSGQKINTFSIGFYEKMYNEAPYAKSIANYLGTNHTELYVTQQDALSVIPKLSAMYDEPFADSSQIPVFLVSQLAKSSVTVSLSGDAGDELFGGYVRYLTASKIKKHILEKKVARFLIANAPFQSLKRISKISQKISYWFDRLIKLQDIVSRSENKLHSLYEAFCTSNNSDIVLSGQSLCPSSSYVNIHHDSFEEKMMFLDVNTYMLDDILTKVDRAAMSVSLETRVPFLSHEIYEFSVALPLEYKICNGVTKRILRDVLYRYVPKQLLERPKAGFGIPLGHWIRTNLKPWVLELLDPIKIEQQGYLKSDMVQRYLMEHMKSRRNHESLLWNILMFQIFIENDQATH